VLARAGLIDGGQQPLVALLFYRLADLPGHLRRGRVAPRRVFEHERLVELGFAHEPEGFLEVRLGFPGEAGDEVGADADGGLHAAQFPDDFQEPLAGIAAVHPFQHGVAAALHRDMGVFHQFAEPPIGFHQVIRVPFRVGRAKADPLQVVDFIHRFEQLHEGGAAVAAGDEAPAVAGDDLAQEGDFLDALRGQLAAFGHDIADGPAAFLAAGVGDDAEGAELVAALHDAHIGGHGFAGVAVEQMLANRGFTACFRRHVHDFPALAGEKAVEVLRGAMQLLRADNQIHIRQAVDQPRAPVLGDAAQETQHHPGAAAAGFRHEVFHFAQRFLLG